MVHEKTLHAKMVGVVNPLVFYYFIPLFQNIRQTFSVRETAQVTTNFSSEMFTTLMTVKLAQRVFAKISESRKWCHIQFITLLYHQPDVTLGTDLSCHMSYDASRCHNTFFEKSLWANWTVIYSVFTSSQKVFNNNKFSDVKCFTGFNLSILLYFRFEFVNVFTSSRVTHHTLLSSILYLFPFSLLALFCFSFFLSSFNYITIKVITILCA